MSGYRDDLRAAHERIASLQREADDTRKLARDEGAAASARIQQLERQVAMLERDDVARALRERLERVEQRAARMESEHKAELDAATMKILSLEEAAHQETTDYDRAFARIGELEKELAKANKNKPELDAATTKILALEEAVRSAARSGVEEVRRELDEAQAELLEARRKYVKAKRERSKTTKALSKKEAEIEQLRERVALQSAALRESHEKLGAFAYAQGEGEVAPDPAPPSTAIQTIPQTDDDLARLSPAGDWEVVYRVPRAVRLRRRHRIAVVGMLIFVAGVVLSLQGAPLAASAALIVGALSVAISMLTGTTVHRGTVEALSKPAQSGDLVARINGADIRLPREAEPAIALGREAVVERGNLGEGTLVVLTAVEEE